MAAFKEHRGVMSHHESDDEFVLEGMSKMQLKEVSSGEEITDPERAMQRQIDGKEVQNRELKLVRNQIEKDKQARMTKMEMRNGEMKSEIMNTESRERDRQRIREQEQTEKERQEWSEEVTQIQAWVKELREERAELEQEKQEETKVLREMKEQIVALKEGTARWDHYEWAQRMRRQDLGVKLINEEKDDRQTAELREELSIVQQQYLEMKTGRETEIQEQVEQEIQGQVRQEMAHLMAERDEAEKMVSELRKDLQGKDKRMAELEEGPAAEASWYYVQELEMMLTDKVAELANVKEKAERREEEQQKGETIPKETMGEAIEQWRNKVTEMEKELESAAATYENEIRTLQAEVGDLGSKEGEDGETDNEEELGAQGGKQGKRKSFTKLFGRLKGKVEGIEPAITEIIRNVMQKFLEKVIQETRSIKDMMVTGEYKDSATALNERWMNIKEKEDALADSVTMQSLALQNQRDGERWKQEAFEWKEKAQEWQEKLTRRQVFWDGVTNSNMESLKTSVEILLSRAELQENQDTDHGVYGTCRNEQMESSSVKESETSSAILGASSDSGTSVSRQGAIRKGDRGGKFTGSLLGLKERQKRIAKPQVIHFLKQKLGHKNEDRERGMESQGGGEVRGIEQTESRFEAERPREVERNEGVRGQIETGRDHEREEIEESPPDERTNEGNTNMKQKEEDGRERRVMMETGKNFVAIWRERAQEDPGWGERAKGQVSEGNDKGLPIILENEELRLTAMKEVGPKEGKDLESSKEFKRLRKLEESRQEPFGAGVVEGEICVQCFGIKGEVGAICSYHPGRLTIDQQVNDIGLIWSCCKTRREAVEEPCATRAHAWNVTKQRSEPGGKYEVTREHQVGDLADAITERRSWGAQKSRDGINKGRNNGEKGIWQWGRGNMGPVVKTRWMTGGRQMSGPNQLINFVTRNMMMSARRANKRGHTGRDHIVVQGYTQVDRNEHRGKRKDLEDQVVERVEEQWSNGTMEQNGDIGELVEQTGPKSRRKESDQQVRQKGHVFRLHESGNNPPIAPGPRDKDGWRIEEQQPGSRANGGIREQQPATVPFPAYNGKIDFLVWMRAMKQQTQTYKTQGHFKSGVALGLTDAICKSPNLWHDHVEALRKNGCDMNEPVNILQCLNKTGGDKRGNAIEGKNKNRIEQGVARSRDNETGKMVTVAKTFGHLVEHNLKEANEIDQLIQKLDKQTETVAKTLGHLVEHTGPKSRRKEGDQRIGQKGHIFMLHVNNTNSQSSLPGLRDEDGWIIDNGDHRQTVKLKFPAYDGKIDFFVWMRAVKGQTQSHKTQGRTKVSVVQGLTNAIYESPLLLHDQLEVLESEDFNINEPAEILQVLNKSWQNKMGKKTSEQFLARDRLEGETIPEYLLALKALRAAETHTPEDATTEDLAEIKRDEFAEVKRRFLNGLGIFEKDVWEWSLFRELATLPELERVAVAHSKGQRKDGTVREGAQRYPAQIRQRIMTVTDGASQDTTGQLGRGNLGQQGTEVGEMTPFQQQQQQSLQQQREHQQVRQQQLDQQHRLQQLQQEKSLANQAGATGILEKMHDIIKDMRDVREPRTDVATRGGRLTGAATQSSGSMQDITGWRPNDSAAGTGSVNMNLNSQIGRGPIASIRGRGGGRGGQVGSTYKGPHIGIGIGNEVTRIQEGDEHQSGVFCFRCRIIGHMAPNCENQAYCPACRMEGIHTYRACQVRRGNANKSSGNSPMQF